MRIVTPQSWLRFPCRQGEPIEWARVLAVGVAIVALSACAPSERSTEGSPREAQIPSELSRAAVAAAREAGADAVEVVSADIDKGDGVQLAGVTLRQVPTQASYEARFSTTCSRVGGAQWQCSRAERSALIKGTAPFIDTAVYGIEDVQRAVTLRQALLDKLSKAVWYLSVCDSDAVVLFDSNDARNLQAVSMARGDVVAQFVREPRHVVVKLDRAALEDPPVLKPVCAYEIFD
jgi:hypothetical protein